MSFDIPEGMFDFLPVLAVAACVFLIPLCVAAIVMLVRKIRSLNAGGRSCKVVDGFWACPYCEHLNRTLKPCENCGKTPRFEQAPKKEK